MSRRLQRLLLVEDNEDDYIIVRDLLSDITSGDLEVEWVDTYDGAYAALSKEHYDVCLLDYRLGSHTGLDLLQELVAGITTPIILLTGVEDYQVDVAASRAGASDYLVKGHINAPLLDRSIRYAMQRKESEVALLQSQRFAQAIVDALPDKIAVIDETGIIVAVNAVWRNVAGDNRFLAATVGENYLDVCSTTDVDYGHIVTAGIRDVMSGTQDLFCFEYGCHSPDVERWYEMRVTRFTGDGPLHVVVAHENITARKQAEVQLLTSELSLATAQQMAHLGSWELNLSNVDDANANQLRWSDEIFRILGYAPGQFEPSNEAFFRSVHPEDREKLNCMMADAIAGGKPYSIDHRVVLPNGAERIVHAQTEIIYSESGRPLKVVGTGQDITERKLAESSLVESQRRLALATESAHIGIWDWNVVANELVWDAEMYALYGTNEGEFSGAYEAWVNGLHPEDREWAQSEMTAALKGRKEFHPQFRVVWPNGEVRHIEAHAVVQRADDGSALHVIGVNWDITERKRNEDALRMGQERFEILSRATNDAVWDWNLLTDGLWWNEGFEHLFGYDRKAIEAGIQSWKQGIHPDDIEKVTHDVYAAIGSGQQSWAGEYRFRRADGSYASIFDRGYIIRDADNQPVRMVGSMQDISERKQAENALRESEARSSAVIQYALDCIITINSEGRVVEFNPAAETTFGFTRAEAMGQDLNDLIVPPAFHAAHNNGIARYLKTGEGPVLNRRIEVPARCKDGREITVELAATAIEHSNPPLFTAYLRDITERKQAENALRESEERFQRIVSNVPGMVYQLVRHPDGSMEWPFVSQGFRELYEEEPEILEREPTWIFDRIHPADRQGFDRSMEVSTEKLSPWSWEGRQRLASGKTKWIQGASRPQRLPDGSIRCDGLITDITAHKEAEEQRDRFFTLSLDMLGMAGLDGYFKRLNPAFSETLGYSERELLAKPFLEFVHPEDKARTLATVEKLSQNNSIVGFENRYRSKEGGWRWLEWKSVVEEGVIYTAARDITERKESESALLRMRDELEVRVEERTAQLAQANAALQIQIAEREGAESEIRTRARQQEAVAELGRRALTDIDMDALLQGATALVAATLDVEIGSILELTPEGDMLRVRAGIGWKGDVLGRVVPANTRSQSGYSLLSKTPTIVLNLPEETRFEPSPLMLEQGVVSGVTVIVTGYQQPFGILGAHTTQLRRFTQDDVHFLQSMSNVLAAALERRRVENEIRQLNVQLEKANEQLRIDNLERQMALGALRDVTSGLRLAKEEAEQARENAEVANRAKSEFLSRMSHELRTPLNAIIGFGQILAMRCQDDDEQQRENIQQILKAGRHLLDLINEVLDIARIEAGHLSLSPEPLAVGHLVQETLDLVSPLAVARHIVVINEMPQEQGGPYALADQQRLKQVLLNFLSNAVKYNCNGGKVIVSCQVSSSAPIFYTGVECIGRLRLLVCDTGPGLTPPDIERLFVPFERLSAARTQIEGSGIGLSLCKRLVEAMNGLVGVESHVGQGSTFWLELPLVQEPKAQRLVRAGTLFSNIASGAVSPPSSPPHAFEGPRTILYIEDNLSNVALIERVLSDLSPHVRLLTAMQGSLGLDIAAQHHPDLILLDVNLPDMMGDVVLRRLKANSLTTHIPVVVLSADATPRQIEQMRDAGASHYLTKPLDMGRFFGVLTEILQSNGST